MQKSGLIAILMVSAAPAFAETAPIRSVTLFEAGLAEILRVGEDGQGANAGLDLSVPLSAVDDVLKSLTVRGEGIRSAKIRLEGESPVPDAFARLPIGPDQIGDVEALLSALPGVEVTLSGAAGSQPVTGHVMGVSQPACAETEPCAGIVLLQDGDTLRRVTLTPDIDVSIGDEAVRTALARGIAALNASILGEDRKIRIETEGEGPVSLSYVVQAPVWKTAYRVTANEDGAMRLQAWAVFENVTGEDWDDVRLTLSSGAPKTLQADLHGRTWRMREAFEAPDASKRFENEALFARASSMMEMQAAPVADLEAGTEATDRGLDSRFTFAEPIDLASGRMISLPFVTEELPIAPVSLWRGSLSSKSGNPDLVLRVENPLSIRLPAGVMTVSDATGYLGDARFPLMAPGEERDVVFGADHKIDVRETVSTSSLERRVTAAKGRVLISEQMVRTSSYVMTSTSGNPGEIVILHPRDDAEWKVQERSATGVPSRDEEGRDVLRFTVAHESSGDVELVVREVRPVREFLSIGTLSRDRIVMIMAERIDPDDRAYLSRILERRDALAALQTELSDLEADRSRAVEDQDRSRRMMEAAPDKSDMQSRFLDVILELEDAIGEIDGKTRSLEAKIEEAEAALDAFLLSGDR
jgi:hypothetical protein